MGQRGSTELHEVLRMILSIYPRDIILSDAIIDKVNEYPTYEHEEPYFYIFSTLVKEGCFNYIYKMGEYDPEEMGMLFETYVDNKGFRPECVAYVLKSILYGLEWIDEEILFSEDEEEDDEYYEGDDDEIVETRKKNLPKDSVEYMNEDEFEEYIWSITEWDHNLEKKAGLKFYNFQISSYSEFTGLDFIFEVEGKVKTQKFSLRYKVLDKNGRLRKTGLAIFINKGERKLAEEFGINLDRHIDEISKIVFFAEY